MSEQNKIDEIKEALAAATPEWYDNGSEIVSKQNRRVGIGGFLKDEDNHLAANAPEYITYLLAEIERKDEALRTMAESQDEWYVGLTPMREYARQALEAL